MGVTRLPSGFEGVKEVLLIIRSVGANDNQRADVDSDLTSNRTPPILKE
jgi:hypothetical protein